MNQSHRLRSASGATQRIAAQLRPGGARSRPPRASAWLVGIVAVLLSPCDPEKVRIDWNSREVVVIDGQFCWLLLREGTAQCAHHSVLIVDDVAISRKAWLRDNRSGTRNGPANSQPPVQRCKNIVLTGEHRTEADVIVEMMMSPGCSCSHRVWSCFAAFERSCPAGGYPECCLRKRVARQMQYEPI